MEWLKNNFAVLNGIFIPLLGIISSLIKSYGTNEREMQRIRRHAEIRSLLPNESEAASNLDSLLAFETEQLSSRTRERIKRKINYGTVATIVIMSLGGGGISFSLVIWAQSTPGILSGLVWTVFVIWTLFIVLLVFAGGLPNLYKQSNPES